MNYILNLTYLIAALLFSPIVIYRMIFQRRYRKGWANRLGNISRKHPQKQCLWIHAVSVGEVNATRTVVTELKKQLPGYEIVISTTTDTGSERANKLYSPEHTVFFFPFDFTFSMKKAFKNLNPAICILMELEIWPNFVDIAKKSNSYVVVANGRISNSSYPQYRKIKPLIQPIFRKLSLVLAQSEEYAARFIELGTPPALVKNVGSLKYDTAEITDKIPGADDIVQKLSTNNQSLYVAGGTGPGEEKIILNTYAELKKSNKFPHLRLVLVPRKPERFNEVASLITANGWKLTRYSTYKQNPQSTSKTDPQSVILVDTMGDLRKFYSLAKVIFVGRSLVPMGGSDMAEAAALKKPVIFGPHTDNFTQTADALINSRGAVRVENQQQLKSAVEKILTESEYANQLAENAQKVIIHNQGATARTVEHIKSLLQKQTADSS